MSKSLGNFTTIRELLDRPVDPMAVRYFVLQAHYRKPLDFTDEAIATAENSWKTLKEGLLLGYEHGQKLGFGNDGDRLDKEIIRRFEESADDDFNFSGSLAVLFELAKELRREGNLLVHEGKTETPPEELAKQWQTLVTLAGVLGLEAKVTEATNNNSGITEAEIEELIQKRQEARKAKNFGEADRIRDQLQDQGVTLIDSREGTLA